MYSGGADELPSSVILRDPPRPRVIAFAMPKSMTWLGGGGVSGDEMLVA